MSAVLVTGARGFVGREVLIELAARGVEAVTADGELLTAALPAAAGGVIHLAARIPHLPGREATLEASSLKQANIDVTRRLLGHYPQGPFVYVSTRDVERAKRSDYAESKLEAERLLEGRPGASVVRLPSVFGTNMRQRKLIPLLFRKYLSGGAAEITSDDEREYVHVSVAARAIVDALDGRGLVSLEGVRIRNLELDALIRAACEGAPAASIAEGRRAFYEQLLASREQRELSS